MSLQTKVFLFFSVLLSLILFEWIFFSSYENRVFKDEMEKRGNVLVKTLTQLSNEPLIAYRITQLENQLDSVKQEKDVLYARIYNADHLVIAATDRQYEGWLFSGDIARTVNFRFNKNIMIVRSPIEVLGETRGMAEIVFSLDTMKAKSRQSTILFLIIFIVEIILAILFAVFLEIQLIRPLNLLSQQVRSISVDSLQSPMVSYSHSAKEITSVVSSIDDMKKKLKIAREELISKTQMSTMVQIAANTAHEIRNPLEAISGAVEILSSEKNLSSYSRDSILIIQEEIQNLNDYLSKFIDFTKPEAVNIVEADINALIDDCLLLLKPLFKKHQIKIEKYFKDNLTKCAVDINETKRVIINLLLNSIEAIQHSGTIKLETEIQDSNIKIVIIDNGSGIDEKHINRVFDPYFTTKKEGSGIGLALSRRVIEQQGGSINIKSRLEKGTTVTITLPIKTFI